MIKYILLFSMILTIPAWSQINTNKLIGLKTTKEKVAKVDKASIKIYPNPAANFVKIKNGEAVDYLKIYNVLGLEVKSYKYEPGDSIDIISLPKGLYFAQLIDKNAEIIKSVRFFKRVYRP